MALTALTSLAACGDGAPTEGVPPPSASGAAATPTGSSSAGAAASPAARPLEVALQGGVVARLPGTETVLVADEDHKTVHLVADGARAAAPSDARPVELPGAPAQVVGWGDTVLVTIRDPGLLLRFRIRGGALEEVGRAKLPADAWGLAVARGGKRAVVTSAWTSRVSGVDVEALVGGAEVGPAWSVEVPREPRGVVVDPNGDVAWVSHLVGARLTKLSGIGGNGATVERIDLPAAPLRAASGKRLEASLGYALALSPDGARLFAPRHGLGALGREAWFGAATVDVLRTKSGDGIAPIHQGNAMLYRSSVAREIETPDTKANLPAEPIAPFTQPRDIRYRARTKTLLVAGEGDNVLAELDALALDPTLGVLQTYVLGKDTDPHLGGAKTCGAPSGLTLSEDESTAYVFCRATYDFARVPLALDPVSGAAPGEPTYVRLGSDPVGIEVGVGRRLFYDATDKILSGGLACAGCHPDGRDDGFVWREVSFDTADGGTRTNFVGAYEQVPDLAKAKGVPRRTPMIAGRVRADGPYGWRAESRTLADRIGAGMTLHRWGGLPKHAPENVAARAGYLASFLRSALVPPPRAERDLLPVEARGKEIFLSKEAACSMCHRPDSEYTDRTAYPLKPLPLLKGFDDEPRAAFKTPSLSFLAGRAPYLHDGSAATVEKILTQNQDRMGKTSHLSEQDLAALAAFLKTL